MPVTRSATRAKAQLDTHTTTTNTTTTSTLTRTPDEDDVSMDDAYESDYDYAYSEEDEGVDEVASQHAMSDASVSSASAAANAVDSMESSAQVVVRDRSLSLGGAVDVSGSSSSHICSPANKLSGVQILDSADLLPVMSSKLREVTDVLQIRESAAFVLLRSHRWNKERLFELFYMDDEVEKNKLLEKSGVLQRIQNNHANSNGTSSSGSSNKVSSCQICCEDDILQDDMYAMPCGHNFCIECWEQFLHHMVLSGPSDAIHTKCPQAGCQELVTEDELTDILINKTNPAVNDASDESNTNVSLLDKFRGYQLRCFVEQNGRTRWCPGNNCSKIAYTRSSNHMDVLTSAGPFVTCDCGETFCLKCGEEPHAPTHCALLQQWKEKCKNESETANWILANTKACPKCSSRIEKNQGCNHMTCQSCKYEFCWICMGDWNEHGANTGGYYKCNKFDNSSSSTGQSDADKAKRELDRYLHYYKRYHAHAEAQKFATRQLADTEAKMVLLQEASDNNTTWIDVQFLKTATEQLIECRRVLKYTYTYAYYMHAPQDSSVAVNAQRRTSGGVGNGTTASAAAVIIGQGSMSQSQKERFEHHQEMLERFTENLSELSEKPLAEMDRADVINQTRVVDRFMKNVLKYVEDGMEE